MSKYGEIVKTDAELKPCPFCGGKGVLVWIDHKYYVTCDTCTCRVASGHIGVSYYKDVMEEAIAAWNTRAERTCCMTDRGECSECGAYIVRAWTEVHDFNGDVKRIDLRSHSYCPNCGAKVVNE